MGPILLIIQSEEIANMEPCGRFSMRLTEDPAGLPYKLSNRWIGRKSGNLNELQIELNRKKKAPPLGSGRSFFMSV
jgi:hypothetical protein